jgi:hypothetical protein
MPCFVRELGLPPPKYGPFLRPEPSNNRRRDQKSCSRPLGLFAGIALECRSLELHRYNSEPWRFRRKTPLETDSNETKICCELSVFLLGEVSLRRFDTVTWNKSIRCKQMRKLIRSRYIRVTGVTLADRAQFLAEVERLVGSHTLHGSESLCKLLRYLAKQAVEHPGVPIKEYQIATEVFGRQADFDPQLDSMVRVQAGRLRSKLAEYYSIEGVNDSTVVEIPKGSYAVVIHDRVAASAASNGHLENLANGLKEAKLPRAWALTAGVLGLALVLAVVLLVRAYTVRPATNDASLQTPQVAAPVRIFWKGFATGPEEPWIIFSNAQFVGAPTFGMRYYDPKKDGKTPILDHYTGVGEVLAVHNLDLVFAALHQSSRVKRGSLFSLDDAKNNDLIFIGSPGENLTLLEIPSTKEFYFRRVQDGARAGKMEIVNVTPRPGESATYFASPSNLPLTEDYAVVALVKGISPEHYELILAGTTTIGTQAAVEFVTRENYLSTLLQRLEVNDQSRLSPFEAIIRVKVAKGVPVESQLVALRKL